jgi:uncharacterized Fe-S cluster protein YjdI
MPVTTHKYTNGEVTVVWKPDTCIHSAICFKGLQEVFNPQKRPWINMEGSTTEKIIEQVRKCPSGALSYFINETNQATSAGEESKVIAEAAQITTIEVSVNGPYLIKTECIIKHSNGTEEVKKGTIALCRCGQSANKPYCDGMHRKVGFEG